MRFHFAVYSLLATYWCLIVTGCNHVVPAPQPNLQEKIRTTSGDIALGNLEAQIEGEMRLAKHRPLTTTQRAAIADLISVRGQILGRISDYELSEQMAEQLVKDAPSDPISFLARANARSIFHRFSEALADLTQAQHLGARPESTEGARASILQATGNFQEARVLRTRVSTRQPTISSIGAEATLFADMGEVEKAEKLFTDAPKYYRDVSPFPVAWLEFQEGKMWMQFGDLEKAKALFESAHKRLPQYAAAQGHLGEVQAALGSTRQAVSLLQPLAASSDDPDYAAQLARILIETGKAKEALKWRDAAAKRYDQLMERHPNAFADHAAEFWLAAGGDVKKALRFAQMNYELRPTPRATELLVEAALAAGDKAVLCQSLESARSIAHPWPNLRKILSSADSKCAIAH